MGDKSNYKHYENISIKPQMDTLTFEAESISYAVCQYYGIQTGENSFGYIASWSQDKDLKELRASLETINKTASELISDIDRHYKEICKERGIDLNRNQVPLNNWPLTSTSFPLTMTLMSTGIRWMTGTKPLKI